MGGRIVQLQLFFNFQLYLHFKSYLLYKLGEIRGNSQAEVNGFLQKCTVDKRSRAFELTTVYRE